MFNHLLVIYIGMIIVTRFFCFQIRKYFPRFLLIALHDPFSFCEMRSILPLQPKLCVLRLLLQKVKSNQPVASIFAFVLASITSLFIRLSVTSMLVLFIFLLKSFNFSHGNVSKYDDVSLQIFTVHGKGNAQGGWVGQSLKKSNNQPIYQSIKKSII